MQEFNKFWNVEQVVAFHKICVDENLLNERTEKVIENYLFSECEPVIDDILGLNWRPATQAFWNVDRLAKGFWIGWWDLSILSSMEWRWIREYKLDIETRLIEK